MRSALSRIQSWNFSSQSLRPVGAHRLPFGLEQSQFAGLGGNGVRAVDGNGAEDGAVGGLAYFDGGELRFGVQIGHG